MEIFPSMKRLGDKWPRLVTPAVLGLFAVMAVHLFRYTLPAKVFSDEQLIYDLIWLDAWGLMFVLSVAMAWNLRLSWRWRGPLMIGLCAVYCTIAVSLIFDGTPFGFNGYWGDQKFRIAMIEKFITWWLPVDFYYRDLPPFYPPVYYLLVSTYARIFSLEAWQMIKIGTQYIYLLGPFIVYYLWRKIVTSYQAFLITLISVFYVSVAKMAAILAPHAFVGNILFIPWWLLYVEQVRPTKGGWKYYLGGGLLGGLIFMTYYFGFFIGALLMVLRLSVFRRWPLLQKHDTFRVRPALISIGLAALFSAPYWLPLLIAMISHGNDPAQQRWHHLDSVGISFKFVTWSIAGMLFLGGIYYAVRRFHAPLYRGLVLLTGSLLLFYLIGATFGALNRPVNLIKANEMLSYMAGPFIGLAVAALLKLRSVRVRRAMSVVALLLLILFVHQFNAVAKHNGVVTARKTHLPNWHLDQAAMDACAGDVFLTAEEALAAFYPVYYFIAINQHYSNPTALYAERYRLLNLLQGVDDPYLFNVALRDNRFDRVDYFMPRVKDGDYIVTLALDNYPNRHTVVDLHYPQRLIDNPSLFVRQEADDLFMVNQPPLPFDTATARPTAETTRDSLLQLARYRLIESDLAPDGAARMDRYLNADWSRWQMLPTGERPFADSISLLGAYAVAQADSLYLIWALQPHQPYRENFRAFLHAYRSESGGQFDNLDFMPSPRVPTWGKEDIVLLVHAIPFKPAYERLHFGLFLGEKRIGDGWWGRLAE